MFDNTLIDANKMLVGGFPTLWGVMCKFVFEPFLVNLKFDGVGTFSVAGSDFEFLIHRRSLEARGHMHRCGREVGWRFSDFSVIVFKGVSDPFQ